MQILDRRRCFYSMKMLTTSDLMILLKSCYQTVSPAFAVQAEAAADGGSGSGAGANYDPYMYVTSGTSRWTCKLKWAKQGRIGRSDSSSSSAPPMVAPSVAVGAGGRDGEPVFRWGLHATAPSYAAPAWTGESVPQQSVQVQQQHRLHRPWQRHPQPRYHRIRFCACRDHTHTAE